MSRVFEVSGRLNPNTSELETSKADKKCEGMFGQYIVSLHSSLRSSPKRGEYPK